MGTIEIVAAGLAFVYIILAIRQRPSCWFFAVASSAAYVPTFFQAKLYLEAALQVFFIAVAGIGYFWWKQDGEVPVVRTLSSARHILLCTAGAAVSLWFGWMLYAATDASFAFSDAFITIFSVIATFMQGRKILENWIYWIVIDLAALGVYSAKGMFLSAVLYGVYVLMAWKGYSDWKRV